MFQLNLQGQVLLNLYIPMQTDQIHIRMQTTRVSRVQASYITAYQIEAAKSRIQKQTRAERGKGPNKQQLASDGVYFRVIDTCG